MKNFNPDNDLRTPGPAGAQPGRTRRPSAGVGLALMRRRAPPGEFEAIAAPPAAWKASPCPTPGHPCVRRAWVVLADRVLTLARRSRPAALPFPQA
ncbi:hypothetical protein ABLV49_24865 (plasmid) [Polaromonas hydrogenivorans]|uniref:Uncharacterized protein n=1 Tax=Polaromonas hydrogenivorans TaxID=335476 RepID=A0AAU7M014_9BURK